MKEDRLSKLPDEVIHRILSVSSLDAKSAVETSVLSKRWRYIWTFLPVLNFHASSFNNDSLRFRCFVYHVLSRRDSSTNLNHLNFQCQNKLDGDVEHIIDSIIDYVTLTPPISTTIQVLSISAPLYANTNTVVRDLSQLSHCQSLTTLNLSNISTEITSFHLLSLQKLKLHDCFFECGVDEFLDPFRGCVNLRSLTLSGCQYYGGKLQRFSIFAPQLTHLNISHMEVDEVYFDCGIELFTPKLQSFKYSVCDLYGFSIKSTLPFVEKVHFDVMGCTDDPNLQLKLIQMFEVMRSAKFVALSTGIIVVLSSMFPDLLESRPSPFTKVQTFELNREIPASSVDMPANVMTYLFGESPGFNFYECRWEGAKWSKHD